MKLHAPFIIGPRLMPALKIGNAFLSLDTVKADAGRHTAVFFLDIEGQKEYREATLQSGMGGFRNAVEPFESLLAFMESAAESVQWMRRTKQISDNARMFPPRIMVWAADNCYAIEEARMLICDENGNVLSDLIGD